ncbi:FG-GAP-like repeat-containing protein [Ekhidna sp.]
MRKIVAILLFCPIVLLAQKPFINNISPTRAEVGQTVTISGSNLSAPGTPRVFFGGVEAIVSSHSGNLIKVTVPAGATHGVVSVINNGEIAQSSEQFFISFSGSDITNYDAEYLVSSTETDAYDICMCDLDGDGLNDISMTHNVGTNDNSKSEITLYRNNTAGTNSFSGTDFQLTSKINNADNQTGFISSICGDLNNDGKPELIYTSNVGTNIKDIYIYENQSPGAGTVTMTYVSGITLKLPSATGGVNRVPRRIKVADIDGDGNSDLVVGNEVDATIHVFRGNGDLTFSSPDEISVGSASRTSSIDLADFNNDGRIDIVSLPFRQPNESIYVLKNNSQPGNVDFELEAGISSLAQRINVATADFDDDGLIDIVVTNQQLQRISFHRNTSSSTVLTFGTAQNISMAGAGPWGIDIADMNGDGKPDVVVASTSTNDELFTVENNSTSGNISFDTPTSISTTNTNLNICAGDLNGDARPDIAFSHNIAVGNPGNLGIFLNRNCVEPVISPDNLQFCFDDQFTLNATKTSGATYLWEFVSAVNGGSVLTPIGDGSSVNATITSGSTTPVEVRVTITHDAGETYQCALTDNATFTLIGGTQPAPPSFGPDQQICVGDDLTLTVSGGPFETYEWTRPDGTSTTTALGSLPITNATINDAGSYTVRARPTSGCFSEESLEFNLEVSQPPLFDVLNNNLDNFCSNTSVTLTVPDFSPSLNYQWKRNNIDMAGETNPTLSTNLSGDYVVEIEDGDGCLRETNAYTINAITLPTSVANGPTETCIDFLTSFTSSSTGQGSFTLQYEWVVEDASNAVIHTATTQDLDFTFPSTGNYEVILNTNYDPAEVYGGPGSGDICMSSDAISVTVSDPPGITFNVTDGVEKCQAETLNVLLQSPASTAISSYNWSLRNAVSAPNDTIISSNFSTNSAIDVSIPIGVDSVYAIVEIVTTIGCSVMDSVKILNFPSAADITSPDADASSDLIILDEDNFIRLSAEGLTNVTWTPEDIFDNANAIDVTAFPDQPSTVITVTGTDVNNCTVSSQLTLELDNLRPKRTFSPNGDGLNDCWEILNSSQPSTQGCKIFIFDARGREIKVADAPFNNNCVWDGNFNGSPVPEGVYYFVFKCDDSQMSKSGSILLAR